MRARLMILATLAALAVFGRQSAAPAAESGQAARSAYLDKGGVIRWRDSGEEVALFGANYCIMSGSDYRMAGLVSNDRKAMIDEDMAHFARMGWTALRLCSWGDWENSDKDGNLVVNDHVDLLDYLVAKARERGIYMLLTPIQTYDPAFPDQMQQATTNSGFSRYFERAQMGTAPESIAAQANYIKQLLDHINPYTGVALKDEPAILFVEMINEPVHHPDDLAGSIDYINSLVGAVRATGSSQLTFFNLSQDFAIGRAISRSRVDGLSFGWYPTGLLSGHLLKGNFLPAVDDYPELLRADLQGTPRIVYEFDQADLLSGYLYPAMVRTFRSVGAQFATMFAYDMLRTAPYNLSWQTHYLNLVHTPRKAVSAVIAAEAMRRLPRMRSYGRYPDDTTFGDFRVDYDSDSSELNAADTFMNAGDTRDGARDPGSLQHLVGQGSSATVDYEGTGAYFLDKVRDGLWRLEVYPDEVLVGDPFGQPGPGRVVSRLLYRTWPMTLHLPDLGDGFFATAVTLPQGSRQTGQQAVRGSVAVAPGVWLLSRIRNVDPASLPARAGPLGFGEYHVPAPLSQGDFVQTLAPAEYLSGQAVELRVRVANDVLPDQVRLWLRPAGIAYFSKPIAMQRLRGNDYVARLPAGLLAPGAYLYAVSTQSGDHATTFPGGVPQQPFEWPFRLDNTWSFRVVPPGTAMRLLDPKADFNQLSFVRPGESYRDPFFRLTPGESDDESALTLDMPEIGKDTPERYAATLFVGSAIAARGSEAALATALRVKLRADEGAGKTLLVTLVEKDGTAWSATVSAVSDWSTVAIPLGTLRIERSVHIPSPYPGLWDYWREAARGRGGSADHIHIQDVERLQLTVMPNVGSHAADRARGASVESVSLLFAGGA
jgi:hypothetical protein